jgi:hypothetical protein
MASDLGSQSVILLPSNKGIRSVPSPQLLENLPMLHRILEEVLEDWHRAIEPYEVRLARSVESPDFVVVTAFAELQPVLLKCLFSYVFFFVAADSAYHTLYTSLNKANTIFRVVHGKPPKSTSLVEKARSIRNWSIAHFPSSEPSHVDSDAAMSWSPLTLSKPNDGKWDLRRLTFGGFRVSCTDKNGTRLQSQDFEVEGLDDLHRECRQYMENFDRTCVSYMNALRSAADSYKTSHV